jgi:uncharacterized protein YigE (DUF2233 family)
VTVPGKLRRAITIVAVALALPMIAHAAAADAPCQSQTFESSAFTVCVYDSRAQDLQLAWTNAAGTPLRSFDRLAKSLGARAALVRFAMNAGMFDGGGKPIGLYVEKEAIRHRLNTDDGSGNFYLKPNGVFSQGADGTMRTETTDAFLARNAPPVWATQSGPMLVIDNALGPQIAADGPSRNIRNGVGIRDAHTAVFVISGDAVSFGRLARFFRDDLKCPDALYFDGAVSSLWIPSSSREDNAAQLGPMVVVTNKN